mmetsp:Transcript_36993/g.59883  ORF Transcript_36993/g.59883 Transcript_36993/m.59883 type:complete len:202 (+) Transcript_36993:1455-2060(+)
MGQFVCLDCGGILKVLFFVNSCLGVLVPEDKVHLVGSPTFVWAKHDNVRAVVCKIVHLNGIILFQELHICSSTVQPVSELHLILDNKGLPSVVKRLVKFRCYAMMSSYVANDQALVSRNADRLIACSPLPCAAVLWVLAHNPLLCEGFIEGVEEHKVSFQSRCLIWCRRIGLRFAVCAIVCRLVNVVLVDFASLLSRDFIA